MEAPKFIGEFGDLNTPCGQSATFTCDIVGLPTPQVSWFHNYREVYDGRKVAVRQEGTTYTLVIKDVDFKDAGDVECQAKNRYGSVNMRAKLNVLGKYF